MHMYVDVGANDDDVVRLNFAFSGDADRRWSIKATQIPCTSTTRAPEGCLQYFYNEVSGQFRTFNFDGVSSDGPRHLAEQDYQVCIRREFGFCCVRYRVCEDVEDAFTLDTTQNHACNEQGCLSKDFVSIPGSGAECSTVMSLKSRYCGAFLNSQTMLNANGPICDCTLPFRVGIFTNNGPDSGGSSMLGRGLCLQFDQVTC